MTRSRHHGPKSEGLLGYVPTMIDRSGIVYLPVREQCIL